MKSSGIRMSTLLICSILAIVLLVLTASVLLFSRTYQQQLIQMARTNSVRTVTQVGTAVDDYHEEIKTVMRTLGEELTDSEEERAAFFDVFLRTRPNVIAVSTYAPDGSLSHCYSELGPPTGIETDGVNLSLCVGQRGIGGLLRTERHSLYVYLRLVVSCVGQLVEVLEIHFVTHARSPLLDCMYSERILPSARV